MTLFSRRLSKLLALMGTTALLASLGACGGGGSSSAASGGSGGSTTLTSSSITLPSNVQVVTAH